MFDPILAFLIGMLAGVVLCCAIVRTIRRQEMARIEAEAFAARRVHAVQRRVRNSGHRPWIALAGAVR